MELLRDYKKFTSKKVIETIENNPQESRKEWLLCMFKRAGQKKSNVNTYQFWQHPIDEFSADSTQNPLPFANDFDNDGLDNRLDTDDDNDNVPTSFENTFPPTDEDVYLLDTDNDGMPNFVDIDDDNDGYLTYEEDENGDGDITNDDTDSDSYPDFLDPKDNDPNEPGNINLNKINRIVGDKKYELSNHLGNVLSVISDRKLPAKFVGTKWFGNNEKITEYWSRTGKASISYNEDFSIDVTCYNRESGTVGTYPLEAGRQYTLQFDLDRDNFTTSLKVYLLSPSGQTIYSTATNNTQTIATTFSSSESGDYTVHIITGSDFSQVETFTVSNFSIADVSEIAQTGNQIDFLVPLCQTFFLIMSIILMVR
ncbi:hypothetical protein [Flavobacterium sp. CS20]|uniref:hypothetical protein n=1 Tax=Flavobacterium sp. CS20 TaxID=2775246 RepID=UPI0035302876